MDRPELAVLLVAGLMIPLLMLVQPNTPIALVEIPKVGGRVHWSLVVQVAPRADGIPLKPASNRHECDGLQILSQAELTAGSGSTAAFTTPHCPSFGPCARPYVKAIAAAGSTIASRPAVRHAVTVSTVMTEISIALPVIAASSLLGFE